MGLTIIMDIIVIIISYEELSSKSTFFTNPSHRIYFCVLIIIFARVRMNTIVRYFIKPIVLPTSLVLVPSARYE